jgi:hypothetical protein
LPADDIAVFLWRGHAEEVRIDRRNPHMEEIRKYVTPTASLTSVLEGLTGAVRGGSSR